MNIKALLCISASLATAVSFSARAEEPAAEAPSGALKATLATCATCHGAKGQSVSPTFPNLAGQSAAYIETQLHAFKDQSRADPDAQAYMWGMAAQLSEDTISAVAKFYAAQAPTPGHAGNGALTRQGKVIFEQGVPARGIPPCASCHGEHAEGMAVFPRLAGQHAPYLFKQLLVIQNVLRTAPVMHGVIKDLTKDQMQAVVAYLESL